MLDQKYTGAIASNRFDQLAESPNFVHRQASRRFVEGAQRSWRRLDGHNQLPKLILGVKFTNGLEVAAKQTDRQSNAAAA